MCDSHRDQLEFNNCGWLSDFPNPELYVAVLLRTYDSKVFAARGEVREGGGQCLVPLAAAGVGTRDERAHRYPRETATVAKRYVPRY